jgi:hypothetical protein
LKQNDLYLRPIGIYRIVGEPAVLEKYWTSYIPNVLTRIERKIGAKRLIFLSFEEDWKELLARLTFGGLGKILNIEQAFEKHVNERRDDP